MLPQDYLVRKASDGECAKLLSKGEVIASFSEDKMEFGQEHWVIGQFLQIQESLMLYIG